MRLEPNTYRGLTFGLSNFDGIETDIRLTKDSKLVIFHDAQLENGELISNLTLDQLEKQGIPTLEDFFDINTVIELSETKQFYIELKPNCNRSNRITDIVDAMYTEFKNVVSRSSINPKSIKIISFVKDMLEPFKEDYPVIPIIPDVNECDQSFYRLKAMPKFFRRSLTWHMKEAIERNFAGVFFAREYLMGWMSFRHPSYEKMIQQAEEMDLMLGTNLGSPDFESEYPKLVKFSDKLNKYPRHSKDEEGGIIAHRGTGTKGVEVPEKDVPLID